MVIPRLKKSLGQNLLIDENIINKILESSCINSNDTILEIGPGSGMLTKGLIKRAGSVIAVEIDKTFAMLLKEKFKLNENIKIFCQDILDFEIKKYKNLKVVSNLPYYITTPIIEYLINNLFAIDDIFITVQKEVAKRIVADSRHNIKDYSPLSIFVQYYCRPKILFNISKNCFRPIPKFDSSFLRMTPLKGEKDKATHEEKFFEVMRACFSQRRKTLKNSLKKFFDEVDIFDILSDLRINQQVRPEQIDLDTYIKMVNSLINKSITI